MIKKIAMLFFAVAFISSVNVNAQNNFVNIQNNSTDVVTFKLSVSESVTTTLQPGDDNFHASIGKYQECQIYIPTYNNNGALITSVTYNIKALPATYQIYWNVKLQRFDLSLIQQ